MKWMIIVLLGVFSVFSNENETIAPDSSVPEVELYSPDGELLKLSSLEGNIVLVHFWASWCAPCKKRLPGLVDVYEQFEDAEFKNADGFEIFSISMDKDKESWMEAIEKYGLNWENHVSELKGLDSKVFKDYELKGIPYTFLLNEKGELIGQNLFDEELSNQLITMQ